MVVWTKFKTLYALEASTSHELTLPVVKVVVHALLFDELGFAHAIKWTHTCFTCTGILIFFVYETAQPWHLHWHMP